MAPPALGPDDSSSQYSAFDREQEQRLPPGSVVAGGRYRVVRELGVGGMAVVYEAEDLQEGRAVALKVVIGKLASRADTAERYHNEVRLAAALSRHPNVVHPLDHGRLPELDDRLYLVTDLVHGQSLSAVLLENPRGMEIERIVRIARDLARALAALHARGIVHRDLKPGNVMVEPQGGREVARLLDFGCAYATGSGVVEASADLTAAHERVGTAIYMAPEQAIGLRPVPAFDLYAFGATVYELLVGTPPYAGASKAEVVRRKCAPDDPPRPVERLRDGIPPRLVALVGACLAREAADRPPDAAAVVAELDAIATELGLPPDRLDLAPAVARPARPRSSTRRDPAAAAVPADAPRPVVAPSVVDEPAPRGIPWAWVGAGVLLLGGVAAALFFGGPTEANDGHDDGGSADAAGVAASATAPGDTPPLADDAPADASAEGLAAAATTADDGDASGGSTGPAEPQADDEAAHDDDAADEGEDDGDDGSSEPAPAPRAKAPPRWSTPECEAIRSGAVANRTARKWSAVLEAVTNDRKCWRSRDDRLLLHLAALTGLGRYEDCARLAAGSKNRQVQRMSKQCEHKIGSAP